MRTYLVRLAADVWTWACECGRVADADHRCADAARAEALDHARYAHPTRVAA